MKTLFYINKILIYSLICVTIIFLYIYLTLDEHNRNVSLDFCFFNDLPDPSSVDPLIRVKLATLMHLHYRFTPPTGNYNVNDINVFYNLLFKQNGLLNYGQFIEGNKYTIQVGNIIKTIHPDLIVQAYETYGMP